MSSPSLVTHFQVPFYDFISWDCFCFSALSGCAVEWPGLFRQEEGIHFRPQEVWRPPRDGRRVPCKRHEVHPHPGVTSFIILNMLCISMNIVKWPLAKYFQQMAVKRFQLAIESCCPGFCLRTRGSAPPARLELTFPLTMEWNETSSLKMPPATSWLGRLDILSLGMYGHCGVFMSLTFPSCASRFGRA